MRTAWGRFQMRAARRARRERGARPGDRPGIYELALGGDPLGPIEVGLVYPTTISIRAQVANPRGPGAT